LIILASSSKTRAKILKDAKIDFKQIPVDFNEDSIKKSSPRSFVYYVMIGKLKEAIKKFGLKIPILVADTVVTTKGLILRKAKNKKEAKKILELQSGSKVSIITAMAYKSKNIEFIDISATHYIFNTFDKDDLKNYLDSKEWEGKAGACMVEGFCKKYIKKSVGYESCAKGLTVEKLKPFLLLDNQYDVRK